MADSNWGAWVQRNGKHRHDREDVAVWNRSESDLPVAMRIYANTKRVMRQYGDMASTPIWETSHHAVLGDGPVRLCARNINPHLYVAYLPGEPHVALLDPVWPPNDDRPVRLDHTVEIPGVEGSWTCVIEARVIEGAGGFSAQRLNLQLTEPDGTLWTAISGFEYGCGWEDCPQCVR